VLYGPESSITEGTKDIYGNEKMVLWVIVIMVVVFGVYPQPLLRITDGFVDLLLNKINVAHLFVK
jgi:NADH-quinone oxidoreductase subunit M